MGVARTTSSEPRRRSSDAGFTISEVVLVLAVVAFLVTVVVVSVGGIESGTTDRDCRTELRALKAAVLEYRADVGNFPPNDDALEAAGVMKRSESPNYDVTTPNDGTPSYTPVGSACDE